MNDATTRLPPDEGAGEPSGPPKAEVRDERNADKFRKAKIIKFFPQSNYGFVKDRAGKEIYFHLDEIRFVGPKNNRTYVAEGVEVGIDVGITSRGTRVTRLKIY